MVPVILSLNSKLNSISRNSLAKKANSHNLGNSVRPIPALVHIAGRRGRLSFYFRSNWFAKFDLLVVVCKQR